LVSVIINFLNAQKYISEAIESVLSQEYSDWELILVDDGSTDASTKVALDYAQRYPGKISYFNHPNHENKGASCSRNFGLSKARGEYIAFLDADDVWLPHKLIKQVQILESNPEISMVYGPAFMWYSWTGKPQDFIKDHMQKLSVKPDSLVKPLDWVVNFLQDEGKGIPTTCGILVRRDALSSLDWFEESLCEYEDMTFYAKVFSEKSVFASSQCICKYRQHPESRSFSGLISGLDSQEREKFLIWLRSYLNNRKVKNIAVKINLSAKIWFSRHKTVNKYILYSLKIARVFFMRIILKVLKLIKSFLRLILRPFKMIISRLSLAFSMKPLSEAWGFDRGLPLHRYYVDNFLQEFSADIRGHCLEFQENSYIRRFDRGAVQKIDILNVDSDNPRATIVADISKPNNIPSGQFDCIICTHVLHIIYDFEKAVSELYRILKPGGVVLFASPLVSMYSADVGDLWRFTPDSLRIILGKVFGEDNVVIKSYGNSLIAAGEIRGLVRSEFTKTELDYQDERFAIEVCARAIKK
jgi:glycosyltransferase involved in cell wall biosynthesis